VPPAQQPRTCILAVTGSVAAYKAVEVASALTQREWRVLTVMTDWACRFVAPLSFSSVTGQAALTDETAHDPARGLDHVSIASEGDVLAVVPATANTIGKLAHGLADNLVTLITLAFEGPVLVAPAMNTKMYESAPVQENLRILEKRGYVLVGPAEGRLACGTTGRGRLAEVDEILAAVERLAGERKP